MPYALSPEAQADLIQLYLDGEERFGTQAAEAYVDRLTRIFHLLVANPRMARERSQFSRPLRAHPVGVHVVLYRIEGDGILVLRVRHGREDWLGEGED